jgi:TPR repeat protein
LFNLCKTGAECVDLGFKYVTGKDVKQDDFKALKFYQKACGLNAGTGCSNLGFMYEEGKGVKHKCFEIILFNALAFFIHKPKLRATTVKI